MIKKEDRNTRYFIDIDLKNQKIIKWNYDQKNKLAVNLDTPFVHRILLTKGQYNKLTKKLEK